MAAPQLHTDGACLTGTLVNLGSGEKPMPPAAIAKIKSDAVQLLDQVALVYDSHIASGEVGASGTGVAAQSAPAEPCTGLLYGRIQSGKTVAMIALVAAALDNGFKVVVVLTSDNVTLVSQTANRFAALDGPIVVNALKPDQWLNDGRHIGRKLATCGVVIVCSKNKNRLDQIIDFLAKIGAPSHPSLILDDEADQATLDTNTARSSRAQQKGLPPLDPTAINSRVVDGLRACLRHHVFLQVTATPYALLLQSVGTQLRPTFTRLLEPGLGYTGGEAFFEEQHIDGPQPPLVYVPSDESLTIVSGVESAPDGLRQALAFFLVAAAVQAIQDPDLARTGQNFLCHTSQLRKQHENLEGLVRKYLERVDDDVTSGSGEGVDQLAKAYEELKRTSPTPPPWNGVEGKIKRLLVNRRIVVVNAEADAELGKGVNFVIGGNILGRGVTIENLLVTYYLREPKVGQMDTMLQHARMYGYRARIMPLTRVFLPEQLAVRFHEIHCIERRLRRHLASADLGKQIGIERSQRLQPTRSGVLDPTYIDAFEAGDHVYPKYAHFDLPRADYESFSTQVASVFGGSLPGDKDICEVTFAQLLSLLKAAPYNDYDGLSSWIPSVLARVIEQQRERCGDRAYIYTRRMSRKKRVFPTGALGGPELDGLRGHGSPVLCLFRDDGRLIPPDPHPATDYWYPSLVLDSAMPNVVVNVTPD